MPVIVSTNLSTFLKIGVTLACFLSLGSGPVLRSEATNTVVQLLRM